MCFFNSQKDKNLFNQARSNRLLYVCRLQLKYDKHFSLAECDFEITNLHYKKMHNTIVNRSIIFNDQTV